MDREAQTLVILLWTEIAHIHQLSGSTDGDRRTKVDKERVEFGLQPVTEAQRKEIDERKNQERFKAEDHIYLLQCCQTINSDAASYLTEFALREISSCKSCRSECEKHIKKDWDGLRKAYDDRQAAAEAAVEWIKA